MATLATTPIRKTASELSNESPLPTPPQAMHDLIRHGRSARSSNHASSIQDGEWDSEAGRYAQRHYRTPLTESQRYANGQHEVFGMADDDLRQKRSANKLASSPTPRSATATTATAAARGALGSHLGIQERRSGIQDNAERPATNHRTSSYETTNARSSAPDARLAGRTSLRSVPAMPREREDGERAALVSESRTPASAFRRHVGLHSRPEEADHVLSARRSGGVAYPQSMPSDGPSKATSAVFEQLHGDREAGPSHNDAGVVRRTSDPAVDPQAAFGARRSNPRETELASSQDEGYHRSDSGAPREPIASFQTPGMGIGSRVLRSGQLGGSRPSTTAPWSVGRSMKRMDRHTGALDKPAMRVIAPQMDLDEEDDVEDSAAAQPDAAAAHPASIREEEEGEAEQRSGSRSEQHSGRSSRSNGSGRTSGAHMANQSRPSPDLHDREGNSHEAQQAMLEVPLGADEDEDEDDAVVESARSAPANRPNGLVDPFPRRAMGKSGPFGSSVEPQAQRRRTAMNDILAARVPTSDSQPYRRPVTSGESAMPPLPTSAGLSHVSSSVVSSQDADALRGPAAAMTTPRSISDFMTLVRQEADRQRHMAFMNQLNAKPSKDLETKFNGYKFKKVRKAGEGGFSTVWIVRGPYAAPDPFNPGAFVDVAERDQAYFAMKQVTLKKMEQVSREEVLEECNLLQTLASKSNNEEFILRFFGWKSSTGSLKILMELGEHDFNQILRARCLDRDQIVRYWYQMLQAVHFTHDEGNIVHTDLKPANFLMANGRLKLIDFGIAQKIPVGTIHIKRDAMIGTPNYMAPETVKAVKEGRNKAGAAGPFKPQNGGPRVYKAGKASDVWALGCILYQMVYSRPPFEAFHGDDKLRQILDPNHVIDFPVVRYGPRTSSSDAPQDHGEGEETQLEAVDGDLLDVLRLTLTYSAAERVTIPQLLQHPLLRPLEQQHRRQKAGASSWLDHEGAAVDDGDTVAMSRTMLHDILHKMFTFTINGELHEDNLANRVDALFDNMSMRQQAQRRS